MIKKGTFEKALSGAAIGATAGFAYGLLRSLLSQPGYNEKLDPVPECFDMDNSAAKLFYDLGKYRYNDENAYKEAMHNMDELFCLEKQLLLKEVPPRLTDEPEALQYGVRSLANVRALRAKIKEQNIYEEVTNIMKRLEKIADSHCHNIKIISQRAQ